jgi:hypothetical protein
MNIHFSRYGQIFGQISNQERQIKIYLVFQDNYLGL